MVPLRLMIPLRRAGYRVAYTLLRGYWFVVRPRVTGALCLLAYDHHLLLIRNTYGRQGWTLPGGLRKRGERPAATIRREVQEEVGVTLAGVHPVGRFTGRHAYKRDTIYVFVAPAPSAAVHIDPGEIVEARWFPVAALPPLSRYAQRAVELWQPSAADLPEAPRTSTVSTGQTQQREG
jgi:8-oxo-dGTP pyrophosphatase MutT (NUDIX family)